MRRHEPVEVGIPGHGVEAPQVVEVVDAKINTLESECKCSLSSGKSTRHASQFDLKLTRENKVKFESISAGIPNISQMGVSASFAESIDDKKILNANA